MHGDGFTSSGPCDSLDWFESEISKEYEVTISPRLGPGPQDAKQGRALNRVIPWTEKGIEYEADPRQAEKLISECGMQGAKPVGTPGVKITFKEHDDDSELPVRLHTAFRSAAARSNYLAADRIDIMFGGKEICRSMAKPTDLSWKALKRLSRYLNGRPRLIYEYPYQDAFQNRCIHRHRLGRMRQD